jgi:serine/threonine protein phosphatase 1
MTITDWMPIPADIGAAHVFVIGDVHGFSRHFGALLAAMAGEATAGAELVLLGDLVDRGPDSVGVLRSAGRPAADLGFARKTVLIGNHELMMLDAMRPGPAQLRLLGIWNGNGGSEVLRQVGIVPHRADESLAVLDHLVRKEIGSDAMAMIENAPSHREIGNLLFVHGGVDPAVPLDDWFANGQLSAASDDTHFAWIRRTFVRHQGPFEGGRIVVHGHSQEYRIMEWKRYPPKRAHMLDGWRIGLDGGTVDTGRVVGAEFMTGRFRVYTAGT